MVIVLETCISDLGLYFLFNLGKINCLSIFLLDLLHKFLSQLSHNLGLGTLLLFFNTLADLNHLALPSLDNVIKLFLHALASSLTVLDPNFKLINMSVLVDTDISIVTDSHSIDLSLQATKVNPQIIILSS